MNTLVSGRMFNHSDFRSTRILTDLNWFHWKLFNKWKPNVMRKNIMYLNQTDEKKNNSNFVDSLLWISAIGSHYWTWLLFLCFEHHPIASNR